MPKVGSSVHSYIVRVGSPGLRSKGGRRAEYASGSLWGGGGAGYIEQK